MIEIVSKRNLLFNNKKVLVIFFRKHLRERQIFFGILLIAAKSLLSKAFKIFWKKTDNLRFACCLNLHYFCTHTDRNRHPDPHGRGAKFMSIMKQNHASVVLHSKLKYSVTIYRFKPHFYNNYLN